MKQQMNYESKQLSLNQNSMNTPIYNNLLPIEKDKTLKKSDILLSRLLINH